MEYRVENKYIVTDAQLALIGARLRSVMPMDAHQTGNCYEIRSLYFDDFQDRCMDENNSGVDLREKFRIRTYGPDSPVLHLECKGKQRGLTRKTSCNLTRTEICQILDGCLPLSLDERSLFNRLQMDMRCTCLSPKVIIFYERTAFVHPSGNVRVTFDRNIMASPRCHDFLEPRIPGLTPVLPAGLHVLEVKYDEFLPDFIARQLDIRTLEHSTFSKYYLGRLAVEGQFPINR